MGSDQSCSPIVILFKFHSDVHFVTKHSHSDHDYNGRKADYGEHKHYKNFTCLAAVGQDNGRIVFIMETSSPSSV